jgi:hypothetical protein
MRAGLAASVALVVSACAGLGANAAVQGGGKLPKTVAVAPPSTPPPSTSAPATPTSPATPAAPAAPAKPAGGAPPAKPASPAGGGAAAGGGGAAGTGKANGGGSAAGNSTPTTTSPAQPSGGGATAFPDGVPFMGDGLINDSGDRSGLDNAFDQDPKSVWKATAPAPVGLWLDAGSFGSYPKFGLYAANTGYTVTIYGSDYNTPPSQPPGQGSGWTQLSSSYPVAHTGKNFIDLTHFQARFYLVWITSGTPAGVADTALLTG